MLKGNHMGGRLKLARLEQRTWSQNAAGLVPMGASAVSMPSLSCLSSSWPACYKYVIRLAHDLTSATMVLTDRQLMASHVACGIGLV